MTNRHAFMNSACIILCASIIRILFQIMAKIIIDNKICFIAYVYTQFWILQKTCSCEVAFVIVPKKKTCATCGAGTAYLSGAPESTPGFKWIRVTRSLVLCVMYCTSFFDLLSFFFLAIVLSVLRFTDSDYPFWYLQNLLIYSESKL